MPNDDALCSQFRQRPVDWRPASPWTSHSSFSVGRRSPAYRRSRMSSMSSCAELLIDRYRQCRVDLHRGKCISIVTGFTICHPIDIQSAMEYEKGGARGARRGRGISDDSSTSCHHGLFGRSCWPAPARLSATYLPSGGSSITFWTSHVEPDRVATQQASSTPSRRRRGSRSSSSLCRRTTSPT